MIKWLKLMEQESTGGGGAAVAEPPVSSPAAESAVSAHSEAASALETPPEPTTSVPERVSPITPDVAEALGVTSAQPIEVKPMAALGLEKTPRSAIQDLIAKGHQSITRNVPFEKKPAVPVATTPTGGQAAIKPAAQVAPVTPAQPAAIPATPVIAATPQVPKYKVGDQEFTAEQLAAIANYQRTQPQPAAQPQPAPQPKAPAQPQLTPEQQKEQIRAGRTNFVNQIAPHIDLKAAGLEVTPEMADILAAGGAPAAELRQQMSQKEVAYALALSRESVANDLNPILHAHAQTITRQNDLHQQALAQRDAAIAPLMEQARNVAVYETEQEFVSEYPELAEHIDTARIVGNTLWQQYPEWVQKATRKEFVAEIAKQTPLVLQRFHITVKPRGAAPVAATPPVTPAAPKPGTPAARIATAAKPMPAPIRGQAPGKITAANGTPQQTRQQFQKVAVGSIADLRS